MQLLFEKISKIISIFSQMISEVVSLLVDTNIS